MANIFSPTIDAEELASRIRSEVGLRRFYTTDSPKAADPVTLPRLYEFPRNIEIKDSYSITDFLDFQDGDFVRIAYTVILKREPDEGGFEHYLSMLRRGEVSRIEILGKLRYSAEGRKHAVKITGLWHRAIIQTAFRIPILGYFFALLSFLCLLPSHLRKWRHFEAIFHQRLQEHRVQFNELARRMEDSINGVIDEASRVRAEISDIRQQTQSKSDNSELVALKSQLIDELSHKADADRVTNELSEMREQVIDHQHNIIDLQRRLDILLEEARRRLSKLGRQSLSETMAVEDDRLFDALYVSLEDHFRGNRKDIKKRLQILLPVVLDAQAGTAASPILDIGCGRGEWLEVLTENDLIAKGIDTNRVMIDRCREFQEISLDATEADAVEYLRSLRPDSLGAVTGINFIEHIPFRNLVTILDEVLRVLKPGGVMVFASSDPQNTVYGVWDFIPTQRNQLPPPMIQYLAEARGFIRVRIERQGENKTALHQTRKGYTTEGNSAIKLALGRDSIMELGYSVIAYKA